MGQAGNGEKAMTQKSLTTVAIAASTFACAALLSFGWWLPACVRTRERDLRLPAGTTLIDFGPTVTGC
jgi:hypothetical protein